MDKKIFYGYRITVPYPEEGFITYPKLSAWISENNLPLHLVDYVLPKKKGEKYTISGIRNELE